MSGNRPAVITANTRVVDKTSVAHLAYLVLAAFLERVMDVLEEWNEIENERWRADWTEVLDRLDAIKDDAGRFSSGILRGFTVPATEGDGES